MPNNCRIVPRILWHLSYYHQALSQGSCPGPLNLCIGVRVSGRVRLCVCVCVCVGGRGRGGDAEHSTHTYGVSRVWEGACVCVCVWGIWLLCFFVFACLSSLQCDRAVAAGGAFCVKTNILLLRPRDRHLNVSGRVIFTGTRDNWLWNSFQFGNFTPEVSPLELTMSDFLCIL